MKRNLFPSSTFPLLFICFTSFLGFSQGTSLEPASYRLKIGDLNGGLDTRYLTTSDSSHTQQYNTYTGGLSFRYQSSIVFNYFDRRNKRFKIGDLLSGEISAGYMNSADPVQKIPFWFAYRFEIGLATIYRISEHSNIGVNLILLRFARDFVTQNISGSGIDLRWRLKRVIVEGGIDNRGLRIVGYVTNANDERNMGHIGLRYLLGTDKNVGLRMEFFNVSRSQNGDGMYNLRAYWGKYF